MLNKYMIIVDETGEKQPALHRGIELARRSGAAVHIVAFVFEAYFGEEEEEDSQHLKELKQTIVAEKQRYLDKIINTIDLGNVQLTSEVVWKKRISKWIVKHTNNNEYSMLIKTGHRSETVFYTPSDWKILRKCTIPVMFVAKKRWRPKNNIMCSIDLGSDNKDTYALNLKIIKQGQELAKLLNGKLYCCYAISVPTVLIDLDILNKKKIKKKRTKKAHALFAKLAGELNIDKNILHIKLGKAEKVIPSTANKLKVQMVIMSTVGRQGIKSKIIGNTAERVMHRLRTDLVAIKPSEA